MGWCSCQHWPRRDKRNTSHVSKVRHCTLPRLRSCGGHQVLAAYRRVTRHALDARVATVINGSSRRDNAVAATASQRQQVL